MAPPENRCAGSETGRNMIKKLEDLLFGARLLVLGFFALVTIYCAYYAFQLRMDAGFEKQLPTGHEYIETFQEYRDRLFGSNRVGPRSETIRNHHESSGVVLHLPEELVRSP